MDLFLGRYEHKLDSKGRVFVPKKILEGIEKQADRERFVLTLGLDPCIYLFTRRGFIDHLRALEGAAFGGTEFRGATRGLGFRSVEQSLDSQGRILLPEELRQRLEMDSEVVVVGVIDRVEIWDRRRWEEQASGEAESVYLEQAARLFQERRPSQGLES